jgi:methylmalonyl-CoA mutase N-terminal domain/subunit
LQVDPTVEKTLLSQLREIKRQRNQSKVNESLDKLRGAAESESEGLMPFIICAVKEYATLGEICDALREVFGEYQPLSIF